MELTRPQLKLILAACVEERLRLSSFDGVVLTDTSALSARRRELIAAYEEIEQTLLKAA